MKHYPMDLQLFAEAPADAPAAEAEPTTPDGAGDQPGGDGGREQPGMVTLTQAQIDDMINKAFARGAAKVEKAAATAKDTPTTPPSQDAALAAEKAKTQLYERRFAAMEKQVPADKADRYVKLAESYIGDDGDFAKALDAALVDFPLPPKYSPPVGGAVGTGGGTKATKLPGQVAAEKARAREQRAEEAAKAWKAR